MDKRLTRLGLVFGLFMVIAVAMLAGQTRFSVLGNDNDPARTQPPTQAADSTRATPLRALQAVEGSLASDLTWGDVDCGGSVLATDALKQLRQVAALPVAQQYPCPPLEAPVLAGGSAVVWGDIDCDGELDAVDALKALRHVAALPVEQTQPCPALGQTVVVSYDPGPSPSPSPTAEPTASPAATDTPAPSLTPAPTATSSPSPSSTTAPTVTPTATPSPSPTTAPSSGIVGFLPFLFLGSPDYDCSLSYFPLPPKVTCVGGGSSPGPQYICILSSSQPITHSECGSAIGPDYSCDRNGDSTTCTSNEGGPAYNCGLAGSTTNCNSPVEDAADYICPSTDADSFDCDTSAATFPDFACDVVGQANVSCQTKP